MNLRQLFPLLDVEKVETETDAAEVNARLREGWSLLMTYPSPDGVGGFYGVFVLGKRRAVTDRKFTDQNFDQRLD